MLTHAPRLDAPKLLATLRIGIPWRTTEEQRQGERKKLDYYFASVRRAGAEPVDVPLDQSATALSLQLADLDGFVLPGSPADVDPARYPGRHAPQNSPIRRQPRANRRSNPRPQFQNGKTRPCHLLRMPDPQRPSTGHSDSGPEIRASRVAPARRHRPAARSQKRRPPAPGNLRRPAACSPSSTAAQPARINSSHHQAIAKPGKDLAVTAHAPDGTIEAVEWKGGPGWVVGVQWHPERMPDDALARALFTEFVAAAERARNARELVGHKA